MKLPGKLARKIQTRVDENFYRTLSVNSDVETIDFSSNDYLGLAKNTFNHASQVGATGSRLISGNYHEIEDLEQFIAQYHNVASSLIFNSGYSANLGLLSSLPQRNDIVLFDQEIHASIRDGIRLSNAKSYAFKHNNSSDLKAKLETHQDAIVYVVVEAIYSISGDSPDLEEMSQLCQTYGAYLIVDEAHSFGIAGPNGSGLINALHLEHQVFARVITFGKALGCHGAAVLGSNELRNYLINFCRSFIYTTAPSLSTTQTIHQQYLKLKATETSRKYLQQLKAHFLEHLSSDIRYTTGNHSAIIAIIIGNNSQTKLIAQQLQNKYFDIKPILSPTVSKGNECIRICLHSFNTLEETAQLAHLINQLYER
ncbi:MAG: pyridoxal phosphate-dependent aminotransferase family protein [Flavobacteriales bacterium]|jgi:8-amino-7-oxononanoate synthase|nr:pyridoxal phosphate-dependent aminotransferase family protein [Flavobacteriales bacterium]